MSELIADTVTGPVSVPGGRLPGGPTGVDGSHGPPVAAGARTRAVSPWMSRVRPVLLPVIDALVLAVVVVGTGAVGWWGACYAGGVLLVVAAEGQHRLRICLRLSDQLPRIATSVAVPLVVCLLWAPAQRVLYLGVCTLGALAVARSATFLVLRAAHRRGRLLELALVIGAGQPAEDVTRLLGEHPELGLLSRGLSGDGAPPGGSCRELGPPERLAHMIEREGITRVIVCSTQADEGHLTSVLRACRRLPVDVCVVPRLPELGMAVPRAVLDEVRGIPMVPLRRPGTAAKALTKRAFDVVVGTALLAVLAPLLLLASAVIRASTSGSTYFRQERITLAGRARSMIKVRTASDEPGGRPCWTVGAERCTPFGAWLRATHLDELPQLVNVLRGDMSLVGPRPERPYYAVRFAGEIPRYADRHRMPGGMTGWAQVHGLHGDTSITERARLDNQYIEYWSPWLDLLILFRTPAAVLGGIARFRPSTRGGSR